MCVKREVGITGDGEVIDGEGVEHLCRLQLARHGLSCTKLCEAVGNKEDEDDEEAIGRALDLEVAEEGVGTEEVESLVDDVGF